jgi:hypothetical protein
MYLQLAFGSAEFPRWISSPIFFATADFTFIAFLNIQLIFISEFDGLGRLILESCINT